MTAIAAKPATLLRPVALFVCAIAALTASSYVSVPMYPVPVTMQTLVVLLVGALAGPRMGTAMVLSWLGLAAAGAPVLSNGGSTAAFVGPTAGYLASFPIAAFLAGLAVKTVAKGHISRFAAFMGAHVVILALGWAWLSTLIGAEAAVAAGVTPFLIGAVIKSALGAALMAALPGSGDRA